MDKKEDKEDFDNLINDPQHHHNDGNDSDYVPDNYDGDEDILGSREAEYAAMDEKGGMMFIDENISKEGETSDHEYGSNKSEEEKIYRERR